ncbi:MAG: tandem-95 repeat protein, partial [Bacteroidia bacterium]|nr:tandem-95 repeat protein [Bacteroidia bacterium]
PPIAIDDTASTNVGVPVTINVQANDTDPDGDPLVTTIISGPNNGTAIVANGDSVIYTPNTGFTGVDTLIYIVSDGNGGTDTAIVVITIDPAVNQCPQSVADSDTTLVNTTFTFNPLANDTDDNGLDPSSVLILSGPLNGVATADPVTGQITYTPNAGFIGIDQLSYKVCDFGVPVCCDSANVTIVVDSIVIDNLCPDAVADFDTTLENTTFTFDPLANDTDDNGLDPSSVVILSGPLNGAATVDLVTGQITYTPNTGFVGNEQLSYLVCDFGLPVCCDTAIINIVVDSIPMPNQCPDAVADFDTTLENTTLTFDPLTNDTDDNGLDPSSVAILAGPLNGVATVNSITGQITYTPNAGFVGTDQLSYSVCDFGMPICCDSAIITIVVDSIIIGNQCPDAVADNDTTLENTTFTFDPLANDIDDNGLDPSSVVILSGPINGVATVNPVTGQITYTPNAGFVGNDLLSYRVCDFGLPVCCDSANITIVVDSLPIVNQCPQAVSDSDTTLENTAITFNPLANDTDDNGLDSSSVAIISGPLNGVATVNPITGQITYTPNSGFIGNDQLSYLVCDFGLPVCCDTANVILTVLSCPLPIANAGADQLLCDTITTTSLSANAPGAGENGVWSVISGNAMIVDTNSATTLVTGLSTGSNTLVWTISNQCGISTDTLVLNVLDTINCCINLPLSAIDDTASMAEDTPVTIFVLSNDIDPEGKIDASSLVVVDAPAKGNYTVDNILGTVTYIPEVNYFGVDSFTYSVCDTGCLVVNCDTATVRLLVNSVNDCPTAMDDSVTTDKNIAIDINVAANDTFDVDGFVDSTSVSIVSFPSNGIASVDNFTGQISYIPFFDFLGPDTLVYLICDDGIPICCDTATVFIKVAGDCDVCVPQCLSPNGDLIGDVLEIKCAEEYPENELRIFNRWGNCVYEMAGYDNTWDGTSNTGPVLNGKELHDGTYYYEFDKGDGSEPINGFILLKRK